MENIIPLNKQHKAPPDQVLSYTAASVLLLTLLFILISSNSLAKTQNHYENRATQYTDNDNSISTKLRNRMGKRWFNEIENNDSRNKIQYMHPQNQAIPYQYVVIRTNKLANRKNTQPNGPNYPIYFD